jgi:hypothetical protein
MPSQIVTRALGKGELAIDTDWRLGPSTARGLWDAGVRAICRYVGLHGPAAGDIDAQELQALIAQGFVVWLVQHTRSPANNILTAETGAADAAAAIHCALAAGYDPALVPRGEGLHAPSLVLDLEGVQGSSVAHATAWCLAVGAAGFGPVVYCGYDPGITGQQIDALPCDPELWCDAGPYSERPKASKPYALKQQESSTLAGVEIDRDEVLAETIYGVAIAA